MHMLYIMLCYAYMHNITDDSIRILEILKGKNKTKVFNIAARNN